MNISRESAESIINYPQQYIKDKSEDCRIIQEEYDSIPKYETLNDNLKQLKEMEML